MRKTISVLLSLILLLALLPSCSRPAPEQEPSAPEPEASAAGLAASAFQFSGYGEELNTEYLSGDRLTSYIEAVFGLTADRWEDGMVIRGTGASAFEIAVLRLGDEEAAEELETVLTEYLTIREGAFTGYAPAEAAMASNGKVRREGRTVGLFICPDPAGAEAEFAAVCRGEELPPLPEPAPEPVEEQDDFIPVFELHDLLHRLLREAACPDWTKIDKGWSDGKGQWVETIAVKYGIMEDQFEECVFAYWGPRSYELAGEHGAENVDPDLLIQRNTYEVVIFQAATEEGAEELAQTLSDYKTRRLEEIEIWKDLEGAPEELAAEAAALETAQTVSAGHYAALVISEYVGDTVRLFPRAVNDPDTSGYFKRCIDGEQRVITDPDPDYPDRVRFTSPGEEDMSVYDTSAILEAWENRDPNRLSGDDRAIYDAAEALLAEIIEDGMSDLEKENAAYLWLVENVNYDWSHMDVLDETARRAYGPYGGLVDRSAVCLGYAASFQLLMDMSGVECITIVGAAFNSTGDHAWNMVRLNGEWYCTDVAWDANARELSDDHEWRYFNLTSDEMAKGHQWDYANTPEATAEDRGGAA